MTVEELIKELSKYPLDYKVTLQAAQSDAFVCDLAMAEDDLLKVEKSPYCDQIYLVGETWDE